jgi:hypothetical protein
MTTFCELLFIGAAFASFITFVLALLTVIYELGGKLIGV